MRFSLLIVSGLLIACRLRAENEAWPVPSAPYRLRIERNADSPWPADAGHVVICTREFESVAVFTADGRRVDNRILWTAEGEPTKVLFRTATGATNYYVYPLREQASDRPEWQPEAGIVLETRARVDGPVETPEQTRALWGKCTNVMGRSMVRAINFGINPHGPSTDFASLFRGYFTAPAAGDYLFATVSGDASALWIDSHLVADWPGRHPTDGGRKAQHHGKITLSKGTHLIEYCNVQNGNGPAAVAAWQPPDKKTFEIMPPSAFVPVGQFHMAGFEASPYQPRAACIGWEITEHNTVDRMTLVNAKFEAFTADTNAVCRWEFDDGSATNGMTVLHVFPRPGLRDVRLTVSALGGSVSTASLEPGRPRPASQPGVGPAPESKPTTVTRKVLIHPQWLQLNEWDDGRLESQKADLASRDLTAMPIADLMCLIALADRIEERPWLVKLAAACFNRMREVKPDQAELLHRLALDFQHPSVQEYGMAEKAFQAVLNLNPPDPKLIDLTRLHYAGFLLRTAMKADAAMGLLSSIHDENLSGEDRRLKRIDQADAFLYSGRAPQAREAYMAIGDTVDRTNALFIVRRRACIESAREFLGRQEYDEVERIVRQIEWETPVSGLSSETGLLMIRAYIGRKEYWLALSRCQALLGVDTSDRDSADLLYALTEVYYALGRRNDADLVLAKLLKEHPYSEAAARAADRWSKRPPAGKQN